MDLVCQTRKRVTPITQAWRPDSQRHGMRSASHATPRRKISKSSPIIPDKIPKQLEVKGLRIKGIATPSFYLYARKIPGQNGLGDQQSFFMTFMREQSWRQ